jgi:uncharacterized protein YcfL
MVVSSMRAGHGIITRVIRQCCLLAVVASFLLVGCSSERDWQWYKPNTNYTVAEFQRDRDQCTKDRALDDQCMKQRGWVPLTSDREPPTKVQQNPRGPRY